VYGGALWLLTPALLFIWWKNGFQSFRQLQRLRLPICLFAITVLTPLVISQFKPIFNSRFAIVGLPLFALIIGGVIGSTRTYLLCFTLILLNALTLSVMHSASDTCDTRTTAEYLAQNTADGDVVIFTSLTRFPIDFYLQKRRLTTALVERSFPEEIDAHPGYEGSIAKPERRALLDAEARKLVDEIVEMQAGQKTNRIFFLHGFHPELDALVMDRLRQHFQPVPQLGMQCVGTSSYFRELSVYR
jgi:hypothetical protein